MSFGRVMQLQDAQIAMKFSEMAGNKIPKMSVYVEAEAGVDVWSEIIPKPFHSL